MLPTLLTGKTYTTVSTVCSAALLRGLVDLDVLNDQVSGIETLGIGVCLCILEKAEEELGRLHRPASPSDAELLSYTEKTPLANWLKSKVHLLYVPFATIEYAQVEFNIGVPCAARPVPPAYRLIGTASLCS